MTGFVKLTNHDLCNFHAYVAYRTDPADIYNDIDATGAMLGQ